MTNISGRSLIIYGYETLCLNVLAIINTRNRGVVYGPNRIKPTRWIVGKYMRPVRYAKRTPSVHWYALLL